MKHTPVEQDKNGHTENGDAAVKIVCFLYAAFFAAWCLGLAVGETWTGPAQPAWWGMPAWFLIGCVLSAIGVSIALVYCVWRWLA